MGSSVSSCLLLPPRRGRNSVTGSSRCRSIISADLRRGTRSYSNLTKTRLAVDRDKAPEILVTATATLGELELDFYN